MKTPLRSAILVCVLTFTWAGGALSQPYTFTTIAGTPGVIGWQDGSDSQAQFNTPAGLAVDSRGVIYVADLLNHTIRQLKQEGTNWVVTTLAGLAPYAGFADGTNTDARFDHPTGVAVAPDGCLFVTDKYNNCIRKLTPSGTDWVVTTIAGEPGPAGQAYADGTNSSAHFWGPSGLAFDGSGGLYIADNSTFTIRQIVHEDTNWIVRTIAGSPLQYGWADGTKQQSLFNRPWSVAVNPSGVIYISDLGNSVIRAIQQTNNDWLTTTVAGIPETVGTNDGPVTVAHFNDPLGITVLGQNKVFATDWSNHTVRRAAPDPVDWYVSTVGGAALVPGTADGTGSIARFRKPYGIVVDKSGVLFVADYSNKTIRMGVSVPSLGIQAFGNEAVISWPYWANNYVLETSTAPTPAPDWTPLTNGVVLSGNTFVLTNAISGTAFFRLRQL